MSRLLFLLIVWLAELASAATPAWQPVGLSGGGAMFNPALSPADPARAIVHCDMSAAYLTRDGGGYLAHDPHGAIAVQHALPRGLRSGGCQHHYFAPWLGHAENLARWR